MNTHNVSTNPTVADVLLLPEVQSGNPLLLAGRTGLEREVRWAHVAADSNIASVLDGGELVLMTANAWPTDPAQQQGFTEDLIAAGISAIALELGHGLNEAPTKMVRSCEQHDIPLIVLQRTVRFVQITQRLHQRIIAEQTEALAAREQVHTMLTELGLNRSPVDYVVERLAATISAPVVLEDPAGRLIAVAEQGEDLVHILSLWASSSEPQLPDGSVRVPVEARGTRWGTLTALPGPAHPAGRNTVLELGAFALALGRISGTDNDQWVQYADRQIFERLLSGRYRNHTEIETQLAAAHMPLNRGIQQVITLNGSGEFGGHHTLERATCETALRRAIAPEGRALIAELGDETGSTLLALISLPHGDTRTALHSSSAETLAGRLAKELDMLVPNTTPSQWRAQLTLGNTVTTVAELIASIEQLRKKTATANEQIIGRVALQHAETHPLTHLVQSLKGSPELNAFARDMLEPLIAHDAQHGPGHTGDLMRVLAAALAHPGNRSRASAEAKLSRSVFYQRIELIEDLLGVDLTDGNTIASLTVAMLALQNS